MPDESPEALRVASRQEWRDWLAQNHTASSGVWLIINRKGSSRQGISLKDAVEEALCFGWIDGSLRPLDSEQFALYMSQRHHTSHWSKANRQRVQRLTEQGLMTPAGLQAVEAAQQDQLWQQSDAVDDLAVPEDLRSALSAQAVAQGNFEAFSASTRKMFLWWIASAKRPETRARRIAETAAQAAQNTIPFATGARRNRS